ncbi:MAG: hypothetical protein H6727_20155 [Myxococcales bacterium]|nr:hypothetical protein [Myxococcales bacterium]
MSSIVALFLMSSVGLLGGLFSAVFVALKVAAKHGWKPQFSLTFVHDTADAQQKTPSPLVPEAECVETPASTNQTQQGDGGAPQSPPQAEAPPFSAKSAQEDEVDPSQEAAEHQGAKSQGAEGEQEAKQADASSSSHAQPEAEFGMTAEYEREAFGPPNATMEWGSEKESYASNINGVWGSDASRFRQQASSFAERS